MPKRDKYKYKRNHQKREKEHKSTLLDEIKQTINFDTSGQPAMHMRRFVPPENPLAACFSFKTRDFRTHEEVKDLLEGQIGIKITSLQYDPLYVHSANSCGDTRHRWIFTYNRETEVETATRRGLELSGNKTMVRRWDEVVNCELEAYQLYRADQRSRAMYNALLRVNQRRKALDDALRHHRVEHEDFDNTN